MKQLVVFPDGFVFYSIIDGADDIYLLCCVLFVVTERTE